MNMNDTMSNVSDMTNKGFDRLTSLGELNMRIFERLAARQMDAVNLYMEHGMRMMKLATEAKGYNELVKGQMEATKELGERLVAESKSNMEMAGQVRDDYRTWFEKNMSEVRDNLRPAA